MLLRKATSAAGESVIPQDRLKNPGELTYAEQQIIDNEKAKEKAMTIEDYINDFTKNNEE